MVFNDKELHYKPGDILGQYLIWHIQKFLYLGIKIFNQADLIHLTPQAGTL